MNSAVCSAVRLARNSPSRLLAAVVNLPRLPDSRGPSVPTVVFAPAIARWLSAGSDECRLRIGFFPGRIGVPWCTVGKKPLPQAGGPPFRPPPGSGMTTNAGMFWLSLPSPSLTQLPRLGLPIRIEPVLIW